MFKPTFQPERWNADPNVTNSHNCYSYFLDKINPHLTKKCRTDQCSYHNQLKPQPGHHSRQHRPIGDQPHLYTCDNMVQRVLDDNPHINLTSRDAPCPPSSYKGALVVDPGQTYHFYRQDRDGTWSHKDGANPATRLDASGQSITDVEQANHNYGYSKRDQRAVHYEDFCGYFCIPTDPDKKFMDRISQQEWRTFVAKIPI